jgi:hypothetical protein
MQRTQSVRRFVKVDRKAWLPTSSIFTLCRASRCMVRIVLFSMTLPEDLVRRPWILKHFENQAVSGAYGGQRHIITWTTPSIEVSLASQTTYMVCSMQQPDSGPIGITSKSRPPSNVFGIIDGSKVAGYDNVYYIRCTLRDAYFI